MVNRQSGIKVAFAGPDCRSLQAVDAHTAFAIHHNNLVIYFYVHK